MEPVLHVMIIGGLIGGIGGVFAEVAPTVGAFTQGGLWIGLAGLVTALGAVIQKYFDDKQKGRDHEIARLRLTLRSDQNRRALIADHKWFMEIVARVPGLPAPPELPSGFDPDEPS